MSTSAARAILQLLPLNAPYAQERLSKHFDVIELWKEADPKSVIAERKDNIEVVVTSAMTPTPADLIDALPQLKAICSQGVGYDAIDVKHAQGKKILVSNTPEVLNDCVADLAFGLLLATARKLGHAERYVRDHQWGTDAAFPLGAKVSHKRLGIVGLGRIGMAIAQRAAGFDMDIRYHNRSERIGISYGYEASLVDLASWADFLIIATVGGDSTRGLINAEVLKALGPNGIIVNISRGSVIDETAMVNALASGELGGAGLDVYEAEPKVPDALKSMDNVVIVPHIGSATNETRKAMIDLVLDNVDAYATTGKVITPVPAL
ncbi:2-hydroxyacid dehydrogenase [Pollutimonas harenae]|uniref:2-hydroxyacid dehydrogenase n=1 Tax=Pollutimonas harenae TaxID=657015 RepID=A0A853GX28_9BURK|nr:2-hydroxyacid dehydrogenase [Pollutimonas harenae]NYT86707.1 2-hydroxyacid dehydrogenase [Pollutimonas harenae]TEA71359.1 2-hydroxyacid dehydrogenase [Pollutimonas harenae]